MEGLIAQIFWPAGWCSACLCLCRWDGVWRDWMGALSGLYIPPFCVPVRLNAASLKELILYNINSCFLSTFGSIQSYSAVLDNAITIYACFKYSRFKICLSWLLLLSYRVLLWHFITRANIALFTSDSWCSLHKICQWLCSSALLHPNFRIESQEFLVQSRTFNQIGVANMQELYFIQEVFKTCLRWSKSSLVLHRC